MKKKLITNLSASEYAMNKISIEMSKIKQSIKVNTKVSEIGYAMFDRYKFDLKLEKEIQKIYGEKISLLECWNRFFENSNLYFQLDFLGNAYGHTFEKFGVYRDYGMVVFYANEVGNYQYAARQLIETWIYNVVVPNYLSARKRHDRRVIFKKENFEFCQVWKLIVDVAIHFDNNLTTEDVKQYIAKLSEEYDMGIKSIGYNTIIFY